MCLIAIAGKGQKKYSNFFLDSLRTGAATNTDGIGYSFKRTKDNTVYLHKGFDTIEDAIKSMASKRLGLNDELIVHLRIGNRGKISTDMCHPFVLSNNATDILVNKQIVNTPVMAHNGTFLDYNNCSVFSDTFQFIQEFMYHPSVIDMIINDLDFFKKVFKDKLKQNRLVFLFPYENADLITIGEFINKDGYLYSNRTFEDTSIRNVGGNDANWEADWRRKYCNNYNWRNGLKEEGSLREFAISVIKEENREDEEEVNFPIPQKVNRTLLDPSTEIDVLDIKTNCKVGVITNVRPRFGYKKATPSELNISEFTASERFKNKEGVTYIEYMGLYIPTEYNTDNQFEAIQIKPTNANYNELLLNCVVGDKEYNMQRGKVYSIKELDSSCMVITPRYILSNEKVEFFTVPTYLLHALFEIKPDGKAKVAYKQYYNMLKSSQPTIALVRQTNRLMEENKFSIDETVVWQEAIVGRRALELLRYNLIEFVMTKSMIKSSFHKRMVV